MSFLRASALAAVTLLLSGVAHAQKFRDVTQQLDAADASAAPQNHTAPMRIQVSYQLLWPSPRTTGIDDQKAAIASAHAALYDLAAHECQQLKVISIGDCKLTSMIVNNVAQPMNSANVFQVGGSATFDLTPSVNVPNAEPKP